MGWGSISGRARTSPSSPRAFGVCDRCSLWYNRETLQNQNQWRGAALLPLNIYVCPRCLDVPQEQLRAIVLPADPVPIMNPRVEFFADYENTARQVSGDNTVDSATGLPVIQGDIRITQDDDTRVTQQTGEPPGGLNEQPGTDANAPGDDDPGLPYGAEEVPKTGPLT